MQSCGQGWKPMGCGPGDMAGNAGEKQLAADRKKPENTEQTPAAGK